MAEKEKRTEDELAPPYAPFTVFFYGDRVYINETEYPVGQCMVDILNLDEALLAEIDRRMLDFIRACQSALESDTDDTVRAVREKLAFAWELVSTLPVYRDMNINWKSSCGIMEDIRTEDELWRRIKDPETKERAELEEVICRIAYVGEHLRLFRKQVALMPDGYFEPLNRRNADAYAEGYFLSAAS